MISGITIAVFFIGAFIALFGAAIIANATFSDRAQFGFYVFLVGAVMVILSIIDVIVRWLA